MKEVIVTTGVSLIEDKLGLQIEVGTIFQLIIDQMN